MRIYVLLAFGIGMAAGTSAAQAQRRELGAHEHGRGSLNIAVEGTRVSMELEAPGADIVGFEHTAKTRQQKAAVEKATKQLSAPQDLFKLPPSAGCIVKEASVALEDEDHDHASERGGAAKRSGAQAKKEAADHDEHGHSQFHAQYTFDCKSPASITVIEFDYFRAFAGAQQLDVNLITSKGQTKFEVKRAKPRLELAGMI